MAMVRKGTFVGRIIRDPETPTVLPNSGSSVTKFTIVCGRSKKNANGEWEDDPAAVFMDCKVFTSAGAKFNLVDIVTKYAKKGDTVYVDGELKTESWSDKTTGDKRSKIVLEVREFQLLGGKSDGPKEPLNAEDPGETMAPPAIRQQQPARQQQPQRSNVLPPDDDNIPF
jgi:single-strand DNA-binding protein